MRDQNGCRFIKENGFIKMLCRGMYGTGIYFFGDPSKSHDYTTSPERYMYVCDVDLGKQEVLDAANSNKMGPTKGYHSILGRTGISYRYVVSRFGQAKPKYLITYID